MERKKLIEAQKQYCIDNNFPYFAENINNPGHCHSCGADIVDYKWEKELITGCHKCSRSFCE